MKRLWLRACCLAAAVILILLAPKRADAVNVSPRVLDFGNVLVGRTGGPLQVTISTYFPASITGISINGVFAQNNNCRSTLPMFGGCTIFVTFKPPTVGPHTGHLQIITGGGVATLVALSGSGLPGLSGRVMGAVQPVSGSSVTLWAAGTSGYGAGPTQLGTAISATDGSFVIALTCPSTSAQIYLTAQGGNAGGGSNSSLMLMTALGRCGALNLAIPLIINEVTTAGSVYALAEFLSETGSGMVGAPATNVVGLGNAFAAVANLVDVSSGSALSTTPGGAGTAPQSNLNTLANALGACVQSNGAASAQCKQLFDCALPGAVFKAGACGGGTGTVADTLAATLSIALNAARVSVDGIYDLATQSVLYSPTLASPPHDWSMPLNFAPAGAKFSRPRGVAIDSSGHVWVTNEVGNSVTALNNDGTLLGNFAPAGAKFSRPLVVAIDSSGHVWVPNFTGNSLTALNNDGTLLGNFAPVGARFSLPIGVAIDSSGHVWATNQSGSSVTALNNDGTLLGNFAPAGARFSLPLGVAIDSSGHVWVTNSNGNSVTALNNDGTLFGNFAPAAANFNKPTFVAIDSSGHVWATNQRGFSVTALNNDGTLLGNFAPAGARFSSPIGVAIDSSGHVWVTNFTGNSVTALNNDGTVLGNFALAAANFNHPFALAVDSSGDIWVTNSSVTNSHNSVTELVGAAAPVKTPFIGPPHLP